MNKKEIAKEFLEYQKFKDFIKDEESYKVDDMYDVEVEMNDVSTHNDVYQGEKIVKSMDDDIYNLEEWQKNLVDNGEYDPWDFEEEDLEEDDYYEDE